jgi:chaperonin GroEL (HSP60 family)
LSAAQDVEAGDGTTSVVVLAGSFLGAAEKMLQKGMHPTIIAEAFLRASVKAVEYLTEISTPVDLNDKPSLLRAASTSLNSKVSSSLLTIVSNSLTYSKKDRISILIHPGTNRGRSSNSPCNTHFI